MSMIMNHNITSLMGQRIMNKNSLAMKRSLEKLSSGLRTKIAHMDHTAEMAIGEVMRSRIAGMQKGVSNSQDGISMIQTAIGGLDQTQSMLNRMRELSVQAANDALTQQDRSYIQVEINEIRDQVDRIGNSTQFNRKNILSGDNAVLWSSTDNDVRAIIQGGLRTIDNYGQKISVDGNFKISVDSKAGQAQVQKSDIFKVRHDNTLSDKNVNASLGVDDVSTLGNIPAGNYSLSLSAGEADDAKITGAFGFDGNVSEIFDFELSDELSDNANVLFEVTSLNEINGTVSLRATANILTQEGASRTARVDNIMLSEDGAAINLSDLFGDNSATMSINSLEGINVGAKFAVNFSAQSPADNAIGIDISATLDSSDINNWNGGPFNGESLHYVLDGEQTGGKEINFTNFFVNGKTGAVSQGSIVLNTDSGFRSSEVSGGKLDVSENEGEILASFDANYAGKVASGNTKLRDIDKFWDTQGNFLLDNPQELILTQGDGTQAKVMLYADDTLSDAAAKLNKAIGVGLGQAKYVDDASKFVSFIDGPTSGSEAVAGTMVIRSVVSGRKGEITISGNEDLLRGLSLNEIQSSKENSYNVSVRDAHTGEVIANSVKITGNKLIGAIHKNIDVEFESMYGINVKWNDSTKSFENIDGNQNEITIHLADNTSVLQTGTGEGEDVMVNIGDMRAHALGLDDINVMSQEAAARSITIIDHAADKVSMQMAKLGASQNRLEHHINNLTKEMEALEGANSNIRDTDYAKEVLEFTRIRILMDANSAMLAQSNAIQQQSILSLMR